MQMLKLRRTRSDRAAFTLVETSIAVLLTGLLMVAALRSAAASKRRESGTSDQVRSQQLATDLMNEILRQAYQEPDDSPVFGPEAGETNGNRTLFDDVDDYIGWTSMPPANRNGVVLPGFTSWTRSANVIWADPSTLGTTTKSDTGLKKITVTVSRAGVIATTIVGYRSIAWVDTIPNPSDNLGNHSPVAVATGSPLSGHTTVTPTFVATGSSDQDLDTLTYVWNFGDGATAAGDTVSHKYTTVGTYSCTLTAYDGNGGVGTAVLTVSVLP
jgi:PKD repeat protein